MVFLFAYLWSVPQHIWPSRSRFAGHRTLLLTMHSHLGQCSWIKQFGLPAYHLARLMLLLLHIRPIMTTATTAIWNINQHDISQLFCIYKVKHSIWQVPKTVQRLFSLPLSFAHFHPFRCVRSVSHGLCLISRRPNRGAVRRQRVCDARKMESNRPKVSLI